MPPTTVGIYLDNLLEPNMDQSEMNDATSNLDDAPNMVAGDVEAAQESAAPAAASYQTPKLIFALGAFAFAATWGYANQEDLKGALGYECESHCAMSSKTTFHSCCEAGAEGTCSASMAANGSCSGEMEASGCASMCASIAAAQAEGSEGACCEEGQQSALAAALLQPVDNTVDELAELIVSEEETVEAEADSEEAVEVEEETEVTVEEVEAETVESEESVDVE